MQALICIYSELRAYACCHFKQTAPLRANFRVKCQEDTLISQPQNVAEVKRNNPAVIRPWELLGLCILGAPCNPSRNAADVLAGAAAGPCGEALRPGPDGLASSYWEIMSNIHFLFDVSGWQTALRASTSVVPTPLSDLWHHMYI